MGKRHTVTRPNVLRLAAESCRDPLTVDRVLSGAGNAQSRAAVQQAAKRLAIELPAPPKEKP